MTLFLWGAKTSTFREIETERGPRGCGGEGMGDYTFMDKDFLSGMMESVEIDGSDDCTTLWI